MAERIIVVERCERREICRLRLLESGAVEVRRFENGVFRRERTLPPDGQVPAGAGGAPRDVESVLANAARRFGRYLDGSVNVGERDFLSPTSAFARNVRWLPGDIQTLHTAGHYIAELYPSAQFHVAQLLRRVFGDAAFLALVAVTSGLLLRDSAPVPLGRLAVVLQILSLLAIVGFDRYWEPLRRKWASRSELPWKREGLGLVYRAPFIALSQLVAATLSVLFTTVIGLSNLALNPLRIAQAWRRVHGGGSLEWTASSVSAGQDVRGRSIQEFARIYAPATRLGAGAGLFATWLVVLGAPVVLLGVSGVGVFVASFTTAFLVAWVSGLPHATVDGKPLYELTRADRWDLTIFGGGAIAAVACLWALGVFPMPAFEGSVGYVALFFVLTVLSAALYPTYRSAKNAWRIAGNGRRWMRARYWAVPGLALALVAVGAARAPSVRRTAERVERFFHRAEAKWRMPEAERRVYAAVGKAMRRQGSADPEALLSDESDAPTLRTMPEVKMPDLQDLRGIPSPRLVAPVPAVELDLPDLDPLPAHRRLFNARPRRAFLLPVGESQPRVLSSLPVGANAIARGRTRAGALAPRVLSDSELEVARDFIAKADYPWITRDELEALAEGNDKGERVDVVELARVYRWEDVKANWDRVEAAQRGGATDRIRLARLIDAVDGVVGMGVDVTASELQRYLDEELGLVEEWSRDYPHIPFASTQPSVYSAGRFSQVVRFLLKEKLPRQTLARALRLDYVDAYWDAPAERTALHRVFSGRPRQKAWESLDLDWGGNEALRRRWEQLETEQSVATEIWTSSGQTGDAPLAALNELVTLLDGVLGHLLEGDARGPYAVLTSLFHLQQVDPSRLRAGDAAAAVLASRLWTQSMSTRLGKIVANTVSGRALPGTPQDRGLIEEVARARYPDDGGDPQMRRLLDWLLLADATETYRELASGYDAFVAEAKERGIAVSGLPRAPTRSDDEIVSDLLGLWRALPELYPNIPAREDMVAEFIAQSAYFSTRDGIRARTPAELLVDFAESFRALNAVAAEPPPAGIEALNDARLVKAQGRTSRSAAGRRALAWWAVAVQTMVIQNDFDRDRIARRAELRDVASRWAEILSSGSARWPHLPWLADGFAEFFVRIQSIKGWSTQALWERFDDSLTEADRLVARHVVPFGTFESVVDRRIAHRSGSFGTDPLLRQTNAVLALGQLLRAAHRQGIRRFDGNPALLTEDFAMLYEQLAGKYPALHWDEEGIVEFYLLVQLGQGWDRTRLLDRFGPEWSLASALAGDGILFELESLVVRDEATLSPAEKNIRSFVEAQTLRVAEKTGARARTARTKAMNALLSLAGLVLSAGEEGQLPEEQGVAWSKERTRRWALGLYGGGPRAPMRAWADSLMEEWGSLLSVMRERGPRFPWHTGSVVDTTLLSMRNARATVADADAGLSAAWKAASDLYATNAPLPSEFESLVRDDSARDLKRKIASARGIDEASVSNAEVTTDDPSGQRLDALLALADVVAQIRVKYGEDPEPAALATRFLEVRRSGPAKYPRMPWSAKGFAASLVVDSYRVEFRDDFWRYATFIDLPAVDQLLAELGNSAAKGGRSPVPPEVVDDVRAFMRQTTGRTPAADEVVVATALHDGVLLLKEFLPKLPLSASNVLAMVELRARVRAMSGELPRLHIDATAEHRPRIGFADRLAAVAMKQGIEAGLDPAAPSFVADSASLLKTRYLTTMNALYELVRDSISPEELEYFKESIRVEAPVDNARRAAKSGVGAGALGTPAVLDDDVISDVALYEILYAKEIAEGRQYLVDLFTIYNQIRRRPEFERAFHDGLESIDRVFPGRHASAWSPDSDAWLADPLYTTWLERRGDWIKKTRGRVTALARAFALLKGAAFTPGGDPEVRSAFARYGTIERYVDAFFDDFDRIGSIPEMASALGQLDREDPFLSDGVRFAVTLFQLHVVDRLYPAREDAARAIAGIASFLPAVTSDYATILGFVPRFESAVLLYDARVSWLRADVEDGPGTDFWRRVDFMQRGVQPWRQKYFLKHAYSVLFHRDLDEDDPAPADRPTASGWRGRLARALVGWPERTKGDEVADFLGTRLPRLLEGATGSRDIGSWMDWLIANGEVDLDGRPTGQNPYAEEVASYRTRLDHYRAAVRDGRAAGKNVRAEEQRIRDIEREFASLERQVSWLREDAARSSRIAVECRTDYRRALWAAGLLLGACLGVPLLARLIPASATGVRRAARATLAVSCLVMGLGLPVAIALGAGGAPGWVQSLGGRLGLTESGPGGETVPRGAAAQLAKSRPWALFTRARRSATAGAR